MEKVSVKKEVLIIIMIVVSIFAMSSQVLATGTSTGPIRLNLTETPTTSNAITPEVSSNETNQEVTNIIAPTTNVTGSTYQNNTTLPQTGDASDYAIFMLIVVAAVIAIYAYKKVREYNI